MKIGGKKLSIYIYIFFFLFRVCCCSSNYEAARAVIITVTVSATRTGAFIKITIKEKPDPFCREIMNAGNFFLLWDKIRTEIIGVLTIQYIYISLNILIISYFLL